MVVLDLGLRLGEPQPDQPVIGAIGDRLFEIVDRLGIALGAVLGVGVAAQPGDQRRLLLGDGNALDQLLAILPGRVGQFLRLILLCRRRRSQQHDDQQRKKAQHRLPPKCLRNVIASAAKQSRAAWLAGSRLLRRYAPRNDGVDYDALSRACVLCTVPAIASQPIGEDPCRSVLSASASWGGPWPTI